MRKIQAAISCMLIEQKRGRYEESSTLLLSLIKVKKIRFGLSYLQKDVTITGLSLT